MISIFNKVIRRSRSFFWRKKLRVSRLVVDYRAQIYGDGKLSVGEGCVLNNNCIIQLHPNCQLTLGSNVIISYGAMVLTSGLVISNKQVSRKHIESQITIGDNVWIGAGSIILPGVTIPPGCVISAGTVVTKRLEHSNSMYAGVPAKFIKAL